MGRTIAKGMKIFEALCLGRLPQLPYPLHLVRGCLLPQTLRILALLFPTVAEDRWTNGLA